LFEAVARRPDETWKASKEFVHLDKELLLVWRHLGALWTVALLEAPVIALIGIMG
jgi:hypothetical protein